VYFLEVPVLDFISVCDMGDVAEGSLHIITGFILYYLLYF